MHIGRLLPALVGSITVFACAYPATEASARASTAAAPASASRYTAAEGRVFELINLQRQRQGLRPLVYNAQLDRMAKIQAENMARQQKMAHTLPGSSLPTLGDRARFVGYVYGRLAENVALGYPTAEAVVQGWMNSSGHRKNILDGGVVETGIGIARSSAGGLYYCQVFGRPLTSP
jgi:uncharacterized protein YkwD